MILIYNSQIILANIFHSIKDNPTINDDFIRHMVLNSYRMIRRKFHKEYGELVICNDSPKCWRKTHFPLYKQNRKDKQKSSDIDWAQIYSSMATIRNEIINVFPYKNIRLEGAEADDVIAVLAKTFYNQEKILIVSNDKDFQQLQIFPNIKQYSTFKKEFLVCENPKLFLYEHIIKGDSSDGIPNIVSCDSSIVDKDKRQNKVTKKVMEDVFSCINNIESSKYAQNWKRNQTLIDFSSIPQDIEDEIIELYNAHTPNRGSILDYMIEHKLVNLMDSVQEFS